MRFLSLVLLSGCALVDANGEAKDGGLASTALFDRGTIPVGGVVTAVSIGELEGTPGLDVALLVDSTVEIAKNMGAGMFTEPFSTSASGYRQLVVDDLNDDGTTEMIVAGDNLLDIYQSNGTGGFDVVRSLGGQSLANPKQLRTASFSTLDSASRAIVVLYAGTNQPRVFSQVLEPSPVLTTLDGIQNEPKDVIVANFAGAGGPDDEVVVSLQGEARLLEFSITAPQSPMIRNLPDSAQAVAMATGDLGSGPEPDVLYSAFSPGPSSIRIRYGSANGLESDGPELAVNLDSIDVGVGDVDGDGRADIIALVRTETTRELHVFLRSTADDFSSSIVTVLGEGPDHLVVGNLNDDGKADVLVFPTTNGVDVLLSR